MGPKTYEGPANPGLHRVGQQLETELRKRRVKGTDEKDLVKNDHEDSARSSGVTGTPWPIAPVFIRRNTTMARPGDSDVTPVSAEFPFNHRRLGSISRPGASRDRGRQEIRAGARGGRVRLPILVAAGGSASTRPGFESAREDRAPPIHRATPCPARPPDRSPDCRRWQEAHLGSRKSDPWRLDRATAKASRLPCI
jgi:hypothetical protein